MIDDLNEPETNIEYTHECNQCEFNEKLAEERALKISALNSTISQLESELSQLREENKKLRDANFTLNRALEKAEEAEERGARWMAEYYCTPHRSALGEANFKDHVEHSMARWREREAKQ